MLFGIPTRCASSFELTKILLANDDDDNDFDDEDNEDDDDDDDLRIKKGKRYW